MNLNWTLKNRIKNKKRVKIEKFYNLILPKFVKIAAKQKFRENILNTFGKACHDGCQETVYVKI